MAKCILWWSLSYVLVFFMVAPSLWPGVFYGGPYLRPSVYYGGS
jgi:hypothetical protein